MDLVKILKQKGTYGVFNLDIAEHIGHSAATLLNTLIMHEDYLSKQKVLAQDDYFYLLRSDIFTRTRLSTCKQSAATKKLQNLNLISVLKRGIPSKNYYKLNKEEIIKILSIEENPLSDNLKHRDPKNKNAQSIKTKCSNKKTLNADFRKSSTFIYRYINISNKYKNKYEYKYNKTKIIIKNYFSMLLPINYFSINTSNTNNTSTSNKYSNSNINAQKNSKMAQANRQAVNEEKKAKKPTFEELIKNRTNSEQLLRWLLEFSNSYYNVHSIRLSRASFNLMLDKLYGIDTDDDGRISIVKTSVERGWKTFFNPDNKPKPSYHNSPSKPLTLEEQKISRKGY